MKILVFIKQIPDVNRISFDSKTMRIIREGVPLMFNSFDKKAVEEAIRIKEKTGSEVVVATMGPPSARDILNESLKMGADDAYLITDRKFAGSDTWVTAKILSMVVEYVKPDLVLTGKYSLDGETSQVPPEIAFMTGMKFKSSVFRIELSEDLKTITVEQDREDGVNRYEGKLICPNHFATFEPKDGSVVSPPEGSGSISPLKSYKTKVENGEVMVDLQ